MALRVSFKVHGKVQGVFFRKFTESRAKEYGLTGWVANTDDDKVIGEAQGDEAEVKKLLKDIDKGPKRAHVVKLEKKDIDTVDGENSFEIR